MGDQPDFAAGKICGAETAEMGYKSEEFGEMPDR
jgi:hypothetical protein